MFFFRSRRINHETFKGYLDQYKSFIDKYVLSIAERNEKREEILPILQKFSAESLTATEDDIEEVCYFYWKLFTDYGFHDFYRMLKEEIGKFQTGKFGKTFENFPTLSKLQ